MSPEVSKQLQIVLVTPFLLYEGANLTLELWRNWQLPVMSRESVMEEHTGRLFAEWPVRFAT